MFDQLSSNNVPDLNQKPVTSQPPIFSTNVLNAMLGVKIYFSRRIDSEIIIESRVLSTRYAASFTIISQRLLVEVRDRRA